ncbi:cytochrome b [Mesorhizobium sp. M3A.F.Ca.ET.174.01.1.1]|nr:cytochrome b [Mesorhizobium sp. M3A.F.Ca.ET.080.04.2.1]RWB74942.1 MAG: cytochrome b [Mesorhizobium sp.]TGS67629.1 cytochrome b [Mesorhizobium sp. M3A.F.Ca.ET.201.01.1.1]TGS86616.1 cytochrome b [Mesorhizobium sp. M3A.F.Ca.ET.175.01.1.1]TGT25064.1 cytochrome b [Mesorhizobium sp. M3A.F.Ca.ET.174.01.1.1]TGT58758.1 cytochrome b [Mesorhizobium sp. M00.F.Ca.ET.170.01.1.1]
MIVMPSAPAQLTCFWPTVLTVRDRRRQDVALPQSARIGGPPMRGRPDLILTDFASRLRCKTSSSRSSTMADSPVASYSKTQIWLHWSIAALILVQFLAHDGMEHVWRSLRRGQEAAAGDWPLAYMHVVLGLAVLALATWRLWLRGTRGVPPVSGLEHPALRLLAQATHFAIYALIFVVPISGAAAWFLQLPGAGLVHVVGKNVLLYLVLLHIAGALVQHFVLKTDVLRQMLAFRQA